MYIYKQMIWVTYGCVLLLVIYWGWVLTKVLTKKSKVTSWGVPAFLTVVLGGIAYANYTPAVPSY